MIEPRKFWDSVFSVETIPKYNESTIHHLSNMTTFTFHFFIFHLSNIRLFTGTDGSTAGYSIGFQGLPLHFIEKTHGSSPTTDSFSTCIDASAIYDQIRLRGFCHGTTKLGEKKVSNVLSKLLADISSKTTWVMGISFVLI